MCLKILHKARWRTYALRIGVLMLLALYMHWAGGRVQVRQETVPLPGIQSPVRVLHLSDLHYQAIAGVSLDYIQHVVDLAGEQKPDLILLTGDYVFDHCKYPSEYAQVLSGLSKAAPTFASMGNHDGGNWAAVAGGYTNLDVLLSILTNAGITPLVNKSTNVTCGGSVIQIVGLGDWWAGNFRPEPVFAQPGTALPCVVLSHNPDTYRFLEKYDWDLMLSGHTHGGQARIPLIGSPWAPVNDKRYLGGLHRLGNHWLHVSRGIAGIFRMRFNCPPEMTVITLVPK